ncbi:MAG: hypothetical protein K9I37_07250 [Crocinitomicaceae bacterium]|jgi:hypothetical protein|nr:hypothetical protein [Crocinitomicaceae bacterium]
MIQLKTLFILIAVFCFGVLHGQRNVKDSAIATPWIGVHYGGNFPSGDLNDRYGYLNHIGIMSGYKTAKQLYLGLDANFMFGNQVKMTGLFDHLVDSQGNITDINGDIAIVLVMPRGFNTNLSIGGLWPVWGSNKNSGIFVHGGAGFLLHHMRIETQNQVIPQLELDYKKGYDRLTTGINTHQFIGYSFMADGGFYNFYGGLYAQQGFTKNRRTIFFDQPTTPVSTDLRLDLQFGFRLGWFIPIYKRKPKDFYYN